MALVPRRYLTLLGPGGLQVPVEDLLQHVGGEARDDDDDDGEPGRAAGQQLHEDEVHVLGVEEGPGGTRCLQGNVGLLQSRACFWVEMFLPDDAAVEERENKVEGDGTPCHEMVHPCPEMSL